MCFLILALSIIKGVSLFNIYSVKPGKTRGQSFLIERNSFVADIDKGRLTAFFVLCTVRLMLDLFLYRILMFFRSRLIISDLFRSNSSLFISSVLVSGPIYLEFSYINKHLIINKKALCLITEGYTSGVHISN